MALVFADRVLETSTTTGTGALTLAGAVSGFRTFSSVLTSPSDTCYYMIQAVDSNGNPSGAWETGLGTYSGANTLTRTTVIASSNSNAAVSFAAGTKNVGIVPVASGPPFSWIDSSGAAAFNTVTPSGGSLTINGKPIWSTTTTGNTEVARFGISFGGASGEKSTYWNDGSNNVGRIAIGFDLPTLKTYFSFGHLYNSAYTTTEIMRITPSGVTITGTIAANNIGTAAAVNLSVGTTAPSSPSAGDLWVDTS